VREVVLQSYGAARTVTGSRHLIRVGGRSVLLECGLFQGHRAESRERNRHLPLVDGLEAVVLSHAHIDHSGAIPALVRDGFQGPVHATPATRDLCRAMLADCAALQEADARYLNKRRRSGEAPVEPLYTLEDTERAMASFVTHSYHETFPVMQGVRATFRDAGHILGSAGVLLEIDGGPTVYFTGDLGRREYPILRDPEPLPDADVILSECTYGLRDHEPLEDAEATIERVVEHVGRRQGKAFVPAFSVGRTQNLVYGLARRRREGRIPEIPILVDSPLALEATRVFADHPECYDEEVKAFIGAGGDPFEPQGVRYVRTVEESKALNARPGPFLVIAGSGMCEGGRILHHLLHGIEDPRNAVLFAGYAAPATLARRIMDGERRVRILGEGREVKARVEMIGALSAHADRSDLLRFLAPARARNSAIYVVHGDEEACLGFAATLREAGHREVLVPETYARLPLRRRGTR
jgi:metallo-beta-lactamase family protein